MYRIRIFKLHWLFVSSLLESRIFLYFYPPKGRQASILAEAIMKYADTGDGERDRESHAYI